jgi:hypothetical protein
LTGAGLGALGGAGIGYATVRKDTHKWDFDKQKRVKLTSSDKKKRKAWSALGGAALGAYSGAALGKQYDMLKNPARWRYHGGARPGGSAHATPPRSRDKHEKEMYRNLARRFHPDLNKGKESRATEIMKELNTAWEGGEPIHRFTKMKLASISFHAFTDELSRILGV